MKQMTEQQALSKLAELCSKGEHCCGEMHEKMRRWGIEEDVRERVVNYLVDHKYVDDERFARAFAHDKLEYNGWGIRKIEQALRQKRVSADIINRVLSGVGTEQYEEKLLPLLQQKRKSIKAKTERERNMKLIRFAMGRGYTYDQIRSCMNRELDVTELEEDPTEMDDGTDF